MKGSYSVPIGSSRSPKMLWLNPIAASIRNRLFSAIPSSICCPDCPLPQRCADISLRAWNTSSCACIANTPRRLTQGPRLVETVTSGEVVTM